ncbi:MAG: UDP-3-O-(3-hydroxymyristoyl)glucosamine N-acyltransferase [Halioglobus sp.]
MYSLGELADRLGLAVTGDASIPISGLASLKNAEPEHLSFLADVQHEPYLSGTRAGAVILTADAASRCNTSYLVSENPYLSMAHASASFAVSSSTPEGRHPSAIVSSEAQVDPSAAIGPHVVIEAGAVVGANAVLEAGVFVGERSHIAQGSRLYPHVVLYSDVTLGRFCTVHSHAVLGADGFGFASSPEGWQKVHQLGGVRIGDRVEIGAGTTVDRGALDDTVIANGVIIDNQVQIAHNCRIGKNTAIAGCVGLAGSTVIGANCTLAGGVGVVGHVEICDNVHVTGMTMVTRSISEQGSYSAGTRMTSTRDWKRNAVRFSRLDDMHQRLAALEKLNG